MIQGNLTLLNSKSLNKPSYQYAYNSKNQLIEVKEYANILGPVSKQSFYTYDVLGRRMEKKVQDYTQNPSSIYTRKYVYDGDNILDEYDGSNQLLATDAHAPLAHPRY